SHGRTARARRRRRTLHGEVRFIGGLLLTVALTAGAFGVDGLIQATRERSRVSSLQAELTSLEQRVATDEQGNASERVEVGKVAGRATGIERSMSRTLGRINWSLQSVPSEAQLARVRSQLDADAACIGQLQGQLDGLGIDWRIDPGKPSSDYFKLSTVAPASAACPGP
ncbi:MAG: hypothetical protein WCD11_05580, partial [Solirubrobacteraceae bacterium]